MTASRPTASRCPGGHVAQWVGEAILAGVGEWRAAAARHGSGGAGGLDRRRVSVGFVWIGEGYPLQAEDVNGLRLGGAWMVTEDGVTPDVVVVGHADSYLWARVSQEGGVRLRSSFPGVGRPASGRPGEWTLAPHVAADTGRRAE